MRIFLEKAFSVGLSQSDMSGHVPRFGTGSNLKLVLELKFKEKNSGTQIQIWRSHLETLFSELDHVHLDLDHPELKGKKLGEAGLAEWIGQRLGQLAGPAFSELQTLRLQTPEGYQLILQNAS